MNRFFNTIRIKASSRFSFFLLSSAVAVAIPFMASAAVTAPNIWGMPPGYWGPIVSCTGNYPIGAGATLPAGSLPNCANLDDLLQTFVNAIYLIMSAGLFIIAPILFIIGGIMMIISSGNPEKIGTARKTMIGAVVGVVIVLCAYLIVNTVISVFHISGIAGFGS